MSNLGQHLHQKNSPQAPKVHPKSRPLSLHLLLWALYRSQRLAQTPFIHKRPSISQTLPQSNDQPKKDDEWKDAWQAQTLLTSLEIENWWIHPSPCWLSTRLPSMPSALRGSAFANRVQLYPILYLWMVATTMVRLRAWAMRNFGAK